MHKYGIVSKWKNMTYKYKGKRCFVGENPHHHAALMRFFCIHLDLWTHDKNENDKEQQRESIM